MEALTIKEEEMGRQEFEIQMRQIEKDMAETLERRVKQEGDWGRAYLLKEIERYHLLREIENWDRFTD
jgi:hypothetical protein